MKVIFVVKLKNVRREVLWYSKSQRCSQKWAMGGVSTLKYTAGIKLVSSLTCLKYGPKGEVLTPISLPLGYAPAKSSILK